MLSKPFEILTLFLLSSCLSFTCARDLASQATPINNIDHQYETILVNALGKIKDNEIDNALSDLEHLVKINPDFKLAHYQSHYL